MRYPQHQNRSACPLKSKEYGSLGTLDSCGGEQSAYRLTRERDDREDPENCSERNKKTFDAGHHQREGIALATGKASARDQDTNRHGYPEQKQERTDTDKDPAKEFRRQFFAWFGRAVPRNENKNRTGRCVNQREQREQRGQASDDVMKNRK